MHTAARASDPASHGDAGSLVADSHLAGCREDAARRSRSYLASVRILAALPTEQRAGMDRHRELTGAPEIRAFLLSETRPDVGSVSASGPLPQPAGVLRVARPGGRAPARLTRWTLVDKPKVADEGASRSCPTLDLAALLKSCSAAPAFEDRRDTAHHAHVSLTPGSASPG